MYKIDLGQKLDQEDAIIFFADFYCEKKLVVFQKLKMI